MSQRPQPTGHWISAWVSREAWAFWGQPRKNEGTVGYHVRLDNSLDRYLVAVDAYGHCLGFDVQ